MARGEEIVRRGESPLLTPEERLATQFYNWERRGRGWQVWGYPVELEPPFRPFLFHYAAQGKAADDARKPTFLSSLAESIAGKSRPTAIISKSTPEPENEREPAPEVFLEADELFELQVAPPPSLKSTKESAERFLLSLAYCSCPVGFEIVGRDQEILTQFSCQADDQGQVRQQLQAHFPDAVVAERSDFLATLWNATKPTVIVDFGLSREFMLPLRTFRGFEVDPLIGSIGALAHLEEQEIGVLQVLFQAVRYPWAASIARAVSDWEGRSFFADAPEILPLAREKIAQPLFAVVIRVAAQSQTHARAWQIVKALGGSLTQFASPTSNELIPLTNDGYPDDDHAWDMLLRRSRRSGMLLNADELVSLAHVPSASVRTPKLRREERKTKAAPAIVLGHRFTLGENTHAGKTAAVTLSADQRTRHCYVIGASGTGKSTLLLNLILQDIENDEGVAVLDPHGDLIDEVLGRIPDRRSGDVALIDPSDETHPVGLNVLKAHSEIEKNLLGSDLVAVFRRLSTSWGDQMTSVLGNAVLAILEGDEGGTLIDLRRFLIDAAFRQAFLKTVRDPEVVYYWEKEYPLVGAKPLGPILTRLDTFLRPKLVRYMMAQPETRLDLGAIMSERKIFLAKLAQGAIGEENAYLLGTLLVSKFHQMALSRQQTAASDRTNFYLYIDEFHHFATPSMAAILSGARKYRLGLVLAHQELQQLWSRDQDVASAVISNPYTRVCFRLGDFDAKKLEEGFSFFGAKDLQNLEVGQAIARVERAEYDFNLKTRPLPPVDAVEARARREHIVALSRERYAARREDVEAHLARTVHDAPPAEPAREDAPRKRATGLRADQSRGETTDGEHGTVLTPAPPSPVGRGGQQHQYLQQIIKRWADGRGWHATIEKQVLDGLGSVDVALEKGGRSVACEISITTSTDHETGNIQKCLAAGFEYVVVISTDKNALGKARNAICDALAPDQIKRVRFLRPEELFSFVEGLEVKVAGKDEGAVPDSAEVLTAKDLESMLRIDVKTIYSYVQRGLLPYVRIQSNLRFLRPEIEKWVAEHQFRPKGGR